MDDCFAALGLPRRHDLAPAEVEARFRERARLLHPDRFSRAPAAERRDALARATRLNDAHRTLRDPRRRAAHLLALHGVDLGAAGADDAAFLEAQLARREALAEARARGDAAAAARVAAEAREALAALDAEVATLLAGPAPAPAALAAAARLLGRARYHESTLAAAEGGTP